MFQVFNEYATALFDEDCVQTVMNTASSTVKANISAEEYLKYISMKEG